MEDWKQLNQEISKALREDGTQAYLRIKTLAPYDVTSGKKTSTYKDYGVNVIFRSTENINEQLARDEISILCSNDGYCPLNKSAKNAFIVYEDKEYEILNSKPIMPGGVILFFKLTCRR